jgi:1-acyl-sn-glycerol-3-phosphate acyltransferase
MLCYIFLFLSALSGILITVLSGIHWLWMFPIFLGIFIVINPLYFCILWISTIFMPKKDPIDKPLKGIYFMIQFSTEWLLTLLRVKVNFNGIEKLPDEPFVLVSNHLSNFDPIVILSKIKKRKIAFISKASNFKIPVAGVYVHNAGFLSIDRENAMRALRTLKRASEMMVREQMIMGIYPEGTRSKTGELLEFKEGAFLLAKKANAPIVVIATHGTNRISKQIFWKKTVVDLNVLEIIDKETVKGTSLEEIATRVRTTIATDLSVAQK